MTTLFMHDYYIFQHVYAQVPPNDLCPNAILVNPLTTVSFDGDTTFATTEQLPRVGFCNYPVTDHAGLWYRIDDTIEPLTFDISTFFPETLTDTVVTVFQGSCSRLRCLIGNDDGGNGRFSHVIFTTTPGTTYYVAVYTLDGFPRGPFKVSFSSVGVPTPPPTSSPTTSPTKTPTNTPTNIPTTTPTSTPTNSPTSTPTKLPSNDPTQSPTRDCDITYNLYNSRTDQLVTEILNGRTIVNSLPPCGRLNIEAVVPCGVSSPNDSVVIELYRGRTLYHRRTEYYVKYFLFGNSETNIYDGRIPAGTYSIRTIADGITSPFTNFTIGGRCK